MTAISDMARFFRYGGIPLCPECMLYSSWNQIHDQCVPVRAARLCAQYVYRACPDAGFLGELLRAISDRLSRLVGPGDVGVV